MATVTRPPIARSEVASPRVVDGLYRLSLDQYERMVGAGILTEHDRTFLLHGLLVPKMTQDPEHTFATEGIAGALRRIIPLGWHVREEKPIGMADGPMGCASAPEPDVAVVPGTRHDYRSRHPRGEDVALVVEVANTSLRKDHELLACYAFAGIPTAWIVDLGRRVVEIHEAPSGPGAGDRAGYGATTEVGAGGSLRVVLGGAEVGRVAVDEILPPADEPGRVEAP